MAQFVQLIRIDAKCSSFYFVPWNVQHKPFQTCNHLKSLWNRFECWWNCTYNLNLNWNNLGTMFKIQVWQNFRNLWEFLNGFWMTLVNWMNGTFFTLNSCHDICKTKLLLKWNSMKQVKLSHLRSEILNETIMKLFWNLS